MSTVREAPSVAPATEGPAPRAVAPWLLAAAVLAVLAGVVLRFVARSDLWLDEALTVNIAGLPIREIPDALRRDGAPPLYYVVLHAWMEVFGTGNAAVRALSGVCSVLTLPVMWFAGRRLAGRGADERTRQMLGAFAVVLFATSPFAVRYATEARMYALVMLLVGLGYLALCRALERPSLLRLALLALITGALLYTQYWTIYLLAVVAVGLVVQAWRSRGESRRAAIGCLVAFAAGGLTFLPWLDTFLYQGRHTGTPWGDPVLPPAAFRDSIRDFGGGDHWESHVASLPLVIVPLLAIFGAARGRWNVDVDVRTRPGVRLVALASVAALALGATAAWLAPEGTFAARYASVVYPLFVLTFAFGFLCFADVRIRYGLLAAVALLGLAGAAQRSALEPRTQAGDVAASIQADARPGDVVVYCPDQLGPGVSRVLDGTDLEQLTYPDGDAPEFVDWVDYTERNEAGSPDAVAEAALDLAGPARAIWLVSATHYNRTEGKCELLAFALQAQRPQAEARVVRDPEVFESESLVRYPPE